MTHQTPRQDIDRRLPSPTEKAVVAHLVDDAILELIAAGNTGFDEDGNWRLRVISGTLYIQKHTGGAWTTEGSEHNPVTLTADAGRLLTLSDQQIDVDSQAANEILAGPASGAAATPAFRALVADDLPGGIDADTLDGSELVDIQSEIDGDISTHAGIADAHHSRYTDTEAQSVADAQIATHAGIADAHHSRYTDAEAQSVADAQIAAHAADDDAHHAPVTLTADADTALLALSAQQLDLDTQGANLVFAGPTSGADAKPRFRALVNSDLPRDVAYTTEQTLDATQTIAQLSSVGSKPVLKLQQEDVSEEFIYFRGDAAASGVTQSLVDRDSVKSFSLEGYFKIYVQDDGNQITDGVYFVPFYTLSN